MVTGSELDVHMYVMKHPVWELRLVLWVNHEKSSLHVVIWIYNDLTIKKLWLNQEKSKLLYVNWVYHDLTIKFGVRSR